MEGVVTGVIGTLRSRAGSLAQQIGFDVRAGRDVEVLPDDVFVVSYPRSGNTWFRFLIAGLREREADVSFATIESLVPDIYANSNRALRRLPRPRILKSHEPFDPRYPRVVYLLRDPRDVAPSYYRYLRMTGRIEPRPDAFLDGFLAGTLDRYGSWPDHAAGWLERGGEHGFVLVRYEELQRDPETQLARVATFVGAGSSPAAVAASVRNASRDSMREHEQRDRDLWKPLRGADRSLDFVGDGHAREPDPATRARWRERIEAAWGDRMRELGYDVP